MLLICATNRTNRPKRLRKEQAYFLGQLVYYVTVVIVVGGQAMLCDCVWSTELTSVQTTSKVSESAEFPGADLRVPVLEWKFAELDANSDRLVDDKELDRLVRLVKKLVKPTSCAVTFLARCDVDRDSSLTLQEWKTCFDDDAEASRSAVDGSCDTVSKQAQIFASRPIMQQCCLSVCLFSKQFV